MLSCKAREDGKRSPPEADEHCRPERNTADGRFQTACQ